MPSNEIVLLACGDIGPVHEPVGPLSSLVSPTLANGDIRFAQAERVYSERGALQVTGVERSRLQPHMASVFTDCGFNVVSVAGNHALDWGPDAFVDTINLLKGKGIEVVGGGGNLEEACRPVIFEKNGVRVGILSYCSVLTHGYNATDDRPGVAPLRVHTYYQPMEVYQPGMPPKVVTIPHEEDLAAMLRQIAEVKKTVHVLILSMHWGLHFIPRMIADYQPVVAKAAVAAGADLIIGHHAHVPKAIEVFDGKACFYSLGNFIISTHPRTPEQAADFTRRSHGVELDPDYPMLPFGIDSKRTLIAKAVLTKDGVKRVSFIPAIIDKQLRPEIIRRDDPRFAEMVRFMEWVSEGHDHKFTVDDNEVIVTGA